MKTYHKHKRQRATLRGSRRAPIRPRLPASARPSLATVTAPRRRCPDCGGLILRPQYALACPVCGVCLIGGVL